MSTKYSQSDLRAMHRFLNIAKPLTPEMSAYFAHRDSCNTCSVDELCSEGDDLLAAAYKSHPEVITVNVDGQDHSMRTLESRLKVDSCTYVLNPGETVLLNGANGSMIHIECVTKLDGSSVAKVRVTGRS